jgi:hypothetical protein
MEFCRATKRFLQKHLITLHTQQDHIRLGQRFVNTYVKDWPAQYGGLYYESDPKIAIRLIDQYLRDIQHTEDLPPELEKVDINYGPAKCSQ